MHKQYKSLASINFLLGLGAIFLYLPYMLQAFDIDATKWIKFGTDLFKTNYLDVLIYFGIGLLAWVIGLTILSLISHPNIPKLTLKVSAVAALVLPLMYVLALKYDWALEFWIKNLAENIKTISYILLVVACGSFVLGVIFNITKRNKANMHHIIQALAMCVLLVLFLAVNGWCGWNISLSLVGKLYGALMGVMAIYLPISTIILMVCAKKRA